MCVLRGRAYSQNQSMIIHLLLSAAATIATVYFLISPLHRRLLPSVHKSTDDDNNDGSRFLFFRRLRLHLFFCRQASSSNFFSSYFAFHCAKLFTINLYVFCVICVIC